MYGFETPENNEVNIPSTNMYMYIYFTYWIDTKPSHVLFKYVNMYYICMALQI